MKLFTRNRRQEKSDGRQALAFRCDAQLGDGLRLIAKLMQLPYYCVMEHAMQVGAGITALSLRDEASKARLHDHLLNHHLLAQALDKRHHDLDLVVANSDVKFGQGELVEASITLLRQLEADGISCHDGVELVRDLAATIKKEREKREFKKKIKHDIDIEALRRIDKESGVVSRLLAVLLRYPLELEEIRTYFCSPGEHGRKCGQSVPQGGRAPR